MGGERTWTERERGGGAYTLRRASYKRLGSWWRLGKITYLCTVCINSLGSTHV